MHWLNEGPYTGETSPTMLTAIGATHVLIGHSEHRQYFNETDTTVNLKLKAALAHGLIPIVCVGENLTEREAGLTEKSSTARSRIALEGIDPAAAAASSSPTSPSGPSAPATPPHPRSPRTPTTSSAPEIAKVPHARDSPQSTRILYGGSVKPDNAATSAASKTSTAHSSAAPASIPPASPRSSTTPPLARKKKGRAAPPRSIPHKP